MRTAIAPPPSPSRWAVDLFNALCGAQVAVAIQLEKVQRGLDWFVNGRLLLLVLATSVFVVLLARWQVALVTLGRGHEPSRVARIEALTHAPLLLVGVHPVLVRWPAGGPAVTLGTVLLLATAAVLALKLVTGVGSVSYTHLRAHET